MDVHIGDHIRIRPAPDVEPRLWDREGLVLDMRHDRLLTVELDSGGDCLLFPDQVEIEGPTNAPRRDPWSIFNG